MVIATLKIILTSYKNILSRKNIFTLNCYKYQAFGRLWISNNKEKLDLGKSTRLACRWCLAEYTHHMKLEVLGFVTVEVTIYK